MCLCVYGIALNRLSTSMLCACTSPVRGGEIHMVHGSALRQQMASAATCRLLHVCKINCMNLMHKHRAVLVHGMA